MVQILERITPESFGAKLLMSVLIASALAVIAWFLTVLALMVITNSSGLIDTAVFGLHLQTTLDVDKSFRLLVNGHVVAEAACGLIGHSTC